MEAPKKPGPAPAYNTPTRVRVLNAPSVPPARPAAPAPVPSPAGTAPHGIPEGILLLLLAMGAAAIAVLPLLPLFGPMAAFPLGRPSDLHVAVLAAYTVAAAAVWHWRRSRMEPVSSALWTGLALGGIAVLFGATLVLEWVGSQPSFSQNSFFEVAFSYVAVGTLLASVVGYVTWAARFVARRIPSAQRPTHASPSAQWDDAPMKTTLSIIGVLVVCTAVLFAFLVDLGCGLSSSCTGVARLRPLLMFLVPMLYGIFALLYLEARQKRAAQDPAWAGKAPQVGSRLAVVLSVVLLAGLALVGTCFGLVLWWPK